MKSLEQHDLTLGKWGPYNKEHLGVCHIANEELGATFNVELFPCFFRRSVLSSNALCESGIKICGANIERTAFTYRYELEWKDKVFCDAHFNITDERAVYIDCEVTNNTSLPQSVNMNLCASFAYPTQKRGACFLGYKETARALLPERAFFIDAADYDDISSSQTLAQDGKYLAEYEADYATGKGTAVGGGSLFSKEHFVKYSMPGGSVSADSVGVRYSAEFDTELVISADGEEYRISLEATLGFSYKSIKIKKSAVRELTFCMTGKSVNIDCVIVGIDADKAEFETVKRNFEPERILGENSLTLKYKDTDYVYKIEWLEKPLMLRRLYTDNVAHLLERTIHDHISTVREDGGTHEGVYENVLTSPLYLEPHSTMKTSFIITSRKIGEEESVPEKKRKSVYKVKSNSDGKAYELSQNIMAYTTLLNVVYPIYTRRGYIRHSTPGKIFNCLYTWDSGFIGMGLATMDFDCAYENLLAYLTPVGDRHSPYIFHGSTVPTQIFLYAELVGKYPEKKEKLKELYPMVKQYYDFFSHNSTGGFEHMKSGLLKPWHIFYNSGGWDDYPPQKQLRFDEGDECAHKHNSKTTPVITTANAVLIAKIMKNVSRVFGIHENDAQFDEDIKIYSRTIQEYLWDDGAGYYSYLIHDENGNPQGIMRYDDGTNYNCGMDGVYPYIAGIGNEEQNSRMLDNIKNGLMTKYGISVVDTRAPYYEPNGYWNGSIWMPHQWILFKALLDKGETDFAVKIAKCALDVWHREVERSYSTFEHFMSNNGRGAGFHQFSGLSTPVLTFFESLFVPGTVTGGFGTLVTKKEWNKEKTALKLNTVSNSGGGSVIICLNAQRKYKFTLNGKPVKAERLTDGAYAVSLFNEGENEISVE